MTSYRTLQRTAHGCRSTFNALHKLSLLNARECFSYFRRNVVSFLGTGSLRRLHMYILHCRIRCCCHKFCRVQALFLLRGACAVRIGEHHFGSQHNTKKRLATDSTEKLRKALRTMKRRNENCKQHNDLFSNRCSPPGPAMSLIRTITQQSRTLQKQADDVRSFR